MPTPPLSEELMQQAVEAVAQYGSVSAAAAALGLPRGTFASRYARAKTAETEFEVAPLPSPDVPVDDLIERLTADYARKKEHAERSRLVPVTIRRDGPIGLLVFGDPHLGSPHTNWPALKRDVELTQKTEALYGTNIGDTGDNWSGKLAHLWAGMGVSHSQEKQLSEWFLKNVRWLLWLGGNHDCHDDKTEALTRRGWRGPDEIAEGDEVLALDTATGLAVWSPVKRKIVRHHAGPMISHDMVGLSFNVTPNHRLLHKRRDYLKRWSGWRYSPAGNTAMGRVGFALSAPSGRPDCELTDPQIQVAAWVLTDGSIRWAGNSPNICVYQSKDPSELIAALDGAGLEWTVGERQRKTAAVCGRALVSEPLPERVFRISAASGRKLVQWLPQKGTLPEWTDRLSERQFDVFLHALMAGDGAWNSRGTKDSGQLHGEKAFLEQVQALAIQHGWSASLSVARGKDWRLNLCRRDDITLDWKGGVEREYDGQVWCLTTEHGNFAVRRLGMVHFSGNCWSGAGDLLPWLSRQIGVLHSEWEQRIALQFPNGREVRIGCYHGAKGYSLFNPGHGVLRTAKLGPPDHLVCAGHTHVSWVQGPIGLDDTGEWGWGLQVGSYKDIADMFGKRARGEREQNLFPSAVVVIDPCATSPAGLIRIFPDTVEGADYLTHLRRRFKRAA